MAEEPTVPFKLNMPSSLRGRVGESAARNGRSVTAEIIARLERSFAADDEYENALDNINVLWDRMEELEELVRSHDVYINPKK